MSEIKSVTIVAGQGVKFYEVGREYNGLLLDHIKDQTVSDDTFHVPHFIGYTVEKSCVFEVINAPMDIEYCE